MVEGNKICYDLVTHVERGVLLFESLVRRFENPSCRRGGKGVSATGVEGSRARRHHVSWRGLRNGGSGGGGRGTSSGVSGSVLAGAAGAACNCR